MPIKSEVTEAVMLEGNPPPIPVHAESPDSQEDMINHPPHYEACGDFQPIDIIRALKLSFVDGNVVKYIIRYPFKNGVEDILKALHYTLWSLVDFCKSLGVEVPWAKVRDIVNKWAESEGKR